MGYEWGEVRDAGTSVEEQYACFQQYWAMKEAFVKARGDGLAFEFRRVEFHREPLEGYDPGEAYAAVPTVDGVERLDWRLYLHRLPGNHWTCVARAPLCDVVDKHGEFNYTLRQRSFSAEAWHDALFAESPGFLFLPVGFLVPEDAMEAYIENKGRKPAPFTEADVETQALPR